MRYRDLGNTGLVVSELGHGTWGMGGWKGGSDDESLDALRRAIELGVNFVDTAYAYGDGHSEHLIGRVLRETDSKVYVATKVPPKNWVWPAREGTPVEEVFPADWIVEATERSLRYLGVERIDVQQFHAYFEGDRKRAVWERVQELAADLDVAVEEVPELALRFCLSHPAVSTVIPGMRSVRNVERNVAAVEKGPLPEAQLQILRRHRWIRNFYPAN
jgi:aryl-alcohol dehydrogenase-like predicted oxidoreductase